MMKNMDDFVKIQEDLIKTGIEFRNIGTRGRGLLIELTTQKEAINIIELILTKKYIELDIIDITHNFISKTKVKANTKFCVIFCAKDNLYIEKDDEITQSMLTEHCRRDVRFRGLLDIDTVNKIYREVQLKKILG